MADTVTSATGTSNAVRDAINAALAKAQTKTTTSNSTQITLAQKQKIDSLISSVFDKLETKLPTDKFVAILKSANAKIQSKLVTANDKVKVSYTYILSLIEQKIQESGVEKFTAPNGNIYKIHLLSTGEYNFERNDGTFSDKKFANHALVMKYLVENTLYKMEMEYTTPNGKKYIVLQNQRDKSYYFKRPDGTISTTPYTVKEVLLYNLLINNPVASIVLAKSTPVAPVANKVITSKVVTPKSPVISANVSTPASVVKSAAPVVAKPAPIVVSAKPTPAPVSTVTKAS
jgi:hypothetical protein